jgi:hypothetical protein
MPKFISLAFLKEPDGPAMEKGRHIRNKLQGHALFLGPYPAGVASPEQIDDVIARLQAAGDAARSRDVDKIAHRKAVRTEFDLTFRNVAHFLEIGANGDVSKLQGAGFDLRQTPKKNRKSKIVSDSPVVELRHTSVSGLMLCFISAVAGAVLYDLEIALDPSREEGWSLYNQYVHRNNLEISGRTPGQNYWFRARGIGETKGPWSAPVCLMSL